MEAENAVLLLGGNKGDRMYYLNEAVKYLGSVGKVVRSSSVYETEPWGKKDQNSFLNMAVFIETILDPLDFLKSLLEIEKKLGRVRKEKWGSRTIDIDILSYGEKILNTELLKIPHPRLHERLFALIPLAEILPDFVHPVSGKTIKELLESCPDTSEVIKKN